MPESRHKYLYERLGDHEFQQLVAALLTHRFTSFVPLPLRQSDGGRDGTVHGSDRSLVYQVKWSVRGTEKDPVAWLDTAVKGEADNLRRLRGDGVRRYALVTNIPSTGKPGTGTFDALNSRLDRHAKEFGFEEMSCFWREAVDGMVDGAPTEILWKYADMLAGWDLIRYLMAEDGVAGRDGALRRLVRKVAEVQWREDERVKFSQVDIDREKVADLFVDVDADRLTRHDPNTRDIAVREQVGAVAAHLLRPDAAAGRAGTLIRGAPGQGKSTLTQYVAQAHRAAFVAADVRTTPLPRVEQPLFPLRFDLSDYARWMSGLDVWDPDTDAPKRPRKRPARQATIECFLADLMAHASGGAAVTPEQVQELFTLVPAIVVLDGLDEVGRPAVRARIVDEINRFADRNRIYDIPPRLLVTTRPSTNALPEPSADLFDVLVLNPLQQSQRDEYLRKWTAVRGITGAEGRALRKTYRDKITEPYLGDLAGNPMQLTILLDLLHKHGAATPTQRTALYDAYVELLLAREANKHPESVRKHQTELREIIPFLGWHLHAHSEADTANAQMTTADLKATIRHFQQTYGNDNAVVDELFEAATDRLWTLTSKSQGAYEFEVLSLREYFAARFLYRYAGEDTRPFDRLEVFRELLRRPYWLNTARFYGGNAEGGDVSELADGIIDELATDPLPQSVIAGWTLLTDGVFTSRPRRARDVLASLCADENLQLLAAALSRGEITPLPELPQPAGGGPDPSWARLTDRIAADPHDSLTPLRVVALRELLNQRRAFASWWADHIQREFRDPARADAWLQLAAACEGAAGHTLDLDGIDLTRPLVAQRLLDTGLTPRPGSKFEADLIHAVLDGRCPDVRSVRSLPAQIAVAFAPGSFLTHSDNAFPDRSGAHQRQRQEALKNLRRDRPDLEAAARHRKFRAGQKGSTFPWAASSAALFDAAGPCWLASEIAILGAASPMNLGFTRQPGRSPFGPNSHPAALLEQTRANADNAGWWQGQLEHLTPDTARAEWALALWCVATPDVVAEMFPEWERVLLRLPDATRRTVIDAAVRCSGHGWLKPLPTTPTTTHPSTEVLLTARNMRAPEPAPITGGDPQPDGLPHRSLLDVARERRWFKVDSVGVYR